MTQPTDDQIQNAYAIAKERYAAFDVDTEKPADLVGPGETVGMHGAGQTVLL